MDLIVRNTLIHGKRKKMDIGIQGRKIIRISPKIKESGRKEIDATGGLTFPGFVDPHVHMDKSLLLGRIGKGQDFSTLEKKISTMRELKKFFTAEDVMRRMIQAAVDVYGRIDILCNNAGIMDRNQPITELTKTTALDSDQPRCSPKCGTLNVV